MAWSARRTRRLGLLATVLMGVGAPLACGAGSANHPPPATVASANVDDDAMDALMEHHRHHHHGGVTLFIAMSLDTLGVSPEQQTAVDKIRADLHARMEPALAAEHGLVATLADGVAAGNIDGPKVEADIAQVVAAAGAVHDASSDALHELHSLLTPPQRAALVDKVESHWAVWQKANADETGAASGERGPVTMLATDLELTAEQVAKIRADLRGAMKVVPRLDPQEIKVHLRAFGDAFQSEHFDARALDTASRANAHMAGWGAAYMAHLVEVVSPVLTPDQRAAFAQTLREHANHNPSAQANP
jgi:Spy/CpxP family protein refolding chaperone